MYENSNITIVDLTKLISIIYQMVEKQGPSNVHDILEAIMNNLPKQESIKKSVSNEEILIKEKKEETGEELNSDLEKQGVEAEVSSVENNNVYLDKGKAAPEPSIYDPNDYSKVLKDKEEYLKTFDTKSTPSDMYYSIDNKETNDNFENVERDKGFSRTLTPPFATTSYHEDTVPYQDEMPIDNENAISAEPRNSMVDWSNASLVEPGQTFGSLR